MIQVFLLPVILSSYFWRGGPGLVSLGTVAFLTDYFLLPPYHSLRIERPIDIARWLTFTGIGLVICLLSEQLHRSRKRMEKEMRLNAVTLSSIGDAVITTDDQSRVTFLNHEAEQLCGWSNAEALGRPLLEVFNIINESTRKPVSDPVAKVLETGSVVGLANHTLLVSKDGREIPINDSGAPIREDDGRIVGVVLVFRDCSEQKGAEKTLRESEERFRTLVEQASDAIFVHDVNGRLLDVNQSACESLGYSRQELLQMSVLDIELESQLNQVQEIWRELKPGHSQIVRGQHRRKDGTIFPVEVSLTSYELQGQLVVAALARNLSGRKEYEDKLAQSVLKLRASEALYASLVEQMPACVFRKDAAGRFVYVNSLFCQIKQLRPEEILGRTSAEMAAFKLTHEKSHTLEDTSNYNTSIIGTGHHAAIMKTGQTIESDEEYITADGEVRFFHAFKTPVFDDHKKIVGSQGIVFDITERKRIDEKLRQANERTKFYMSRLPLAFIAWDQDFCVTEWNSAAEKIFGWTAAEAVGQHAYKLIVPPDTQPLVNKVWQEIIAGGNLASHSINDNISKSGRRLTGEWRNMALRNAHNQICGCLSIVEDITERIRGEKQRTELETQLRQSQKMEAIGQLSGGIAHDFNNLLTIIQGNAALLQNLELQPEEIRDASNQISRAAERAAGLTRQLLLFARKQQMQLINLDLNETVAQITKMLQRILGEDITLRTEYAPTLPLIQADTGMIEQILLNLAVNARDAMNEGGKLTIRTSTEKRPGKTPGTEEIFACLQVADNGTGIAPEILPRIFEPFFTTKEVGKGTGLGLATVYGIVQQHQGIINVQSDPGKGSTFTLFFPASHAPEASPATDKPRSALPRGTETILLVEDELPLRTFVSDLLQRCGYTVLEAESGPAAIKIWTANREKIDLLFTDVIMPEDMNGIELGRRLLAEKNTLKVIYTSGYTGNLEGRRATLVEGANFIRKPFKPAAIAAFIRNKLDGKITAA